MTVFELLSSTTLSVLATATTTAMRETETWTLLLLGGLRGSWGRMLNDVMIRYYNHLCFMCLLFFIVVAFGLPCLSP